MAPETAGGEPGTGGAALPRHVAIIMDGNGRWAKKRFLPRFAGHKAGVEAVRTVTRAARAAGMSRSSSQRLRNRLVGTPFDRSWEQVLAVHAQRLANPFAADTAPARPAGGQAPHAAAQARP